MGFHQRQKSPNYINWSYFEQIVVKSTQFGQNWVLFYRKWYTDGWIIGWKIGIEKVKLKFSRCSRHIQFLVKVTFLGCYHQVQNWQRLFYRIHNPGGGQSDLPKFKFSVEFPIGLHVILQLQIKKFKTAHYRKCKIILTENLLRCNHAPLLK